MIIIHGASGRRNYLDQMKSGASSTLSFVQHEVFGNLILSLDKIRKRLIISHVFNPFKRITLIDLSKIKMISVKKEFRDIRQGVLSQRNPEDFLEKMFFHFEFNDNNRSLALPIFEKFAQESGDVLS